MLPPRFVYKYHLLNVFLIELLVNHRFYLADKAQLNDPLDAGFAMQFEDYLKLYNELYSRQGDPEQDKQLRALYAWNLEYGDDKMFLELSGLPQGLRTTCFTEDGRNPLMWSHYAANHNGVCLKFDLEKDDRLRESLKPVTYLDELVAIKEKADFERSQLFPNRILIAE